jgi:hypothetical protein
VHLALPLIVQVSSLPEVRNHTRSKTRYEHPYGHQTAVPSNYPRFSKSESLRHCSLEYSRLRPNDAVEPDEVTSSTIWPDLKNNEIRCSMSKHVRKRRVVPMAPLPAVQTSCLPVFRHETHSKMHSNHCYGPQTAVSSKRRRYESDDDKRPT